MDNGFAIMGSGYYSKDFDEVAYLEMALICVDGQGVIERVIRPEEEDYHEVRGHYEAQGSLTVLEEDRVLLPGFVDLHLHGPQWAQSGTALDRPLEVWLNDYTFPLEARFKDLDFAEGVYRDLVRTTLKNGTTTAMYFATVDREPSLLLGQICAGEGQRAFVGKVAMDDPEGCFDYYKDRDAGASIEETDRFIRAMLKLQDTCRQKVYPVVTPRFIPTCTHKSLKGLGALASDYGLLIQTHASESDWAHHFVKEKTGKNDALALKDLGLMTDKTVVAHAPFLEPEDVKIMAEAGGTIAHCPLSNAYFANAVLPVKDFRAQGINIGLATDISGGYSPSMYSAIRQAVISSRMLQDGVNPALDAATRGRRDAAITMNNAFYMATVAGGIALNLPIGKFEPGYIFDAQALDTRVNIPRFGQEKTPDDLLHKILTMAQTENVRDVWVQGIKCDLVS